MTTTCEYPDGCTTSVTIPPDAPITQHPNTGSDVIPLAGIALLLVAIGAVIARAARSNKS